MSIERIDTGTLVVRNLVAGNSTVPGEDPLVSVAVPVIEFPDSDFTAGPLSIHCPGSNFQFIESLCVGGEWLFNVAEDWPSVNGVFQSVRVEEESTELKAQGKLGELEWEGVFINTGSTSEVAIDLPPQSLAKLEFLKERVDPLTWVSGGTLNGQVISRQNTESETETSISIILDAVDFDSPDGLFAGAGVTTRFLLTPASGNRFSLEAELLGGELLLQDFYRDFSDKSLTFEVSALLSDTSLEFQRFNVTDHESLRLTGQADFPLATDAVAELVLREFELNFPLAFDRYLESTAQVFGLGGLETSGSVCWTGDWSPGSARNGELLISDLSVMDRAKGRFTVGNLNGQLHTGTDSRLTWDSLSFEKMNLGSGSAGLELLPERISLTESMIIDVMGGQLELESFAFSLPKGW